MTKLRRSPSIRTTRQSPLSLLVGRAWSTVFVAAPVALLAGAAHAQESGAPQIAQVLVTGARTLDEAPYMNGGVARRGGPRARRPGAPPRRCDATPAPR